MLVILGVILSKILRPLSLLNWGDETCICYNKILTHLSLSSFISVSLYHSCNIKLLFFLKRKFITEFTVDSLLRNSLSDLG